MLEVPNEYKQIHQDKLSQIREMCIEDNYYLVDLFTGDLDQIEAN